MFRLAADGALVSLLQDAGFGDIKVAPVALERHYAQLDDFIAETIEMGAMFASAYAQLSADEQSALRDRVTEQAAAFRADDGTVVLPGSSLVASASA